MDIQEQYQIAVDTKSDINEHLPILKQYAEKCDHVTEMGARGGNSSVALMAANPNTFISYDYQYDIPEEHLRNSVTSLIKIFKEMQKDGKNFYYIGKDVLTVNIEETDMLFIDTWHCYDQLKAELDLHAQKVKKYIAFHDTFLYGEMGEGYPAMDSNHPQRDKLNGTGGIKKAIFEFLEKYPNWKIVYETENNNGLMVIENYAN
jgi:hypothetical protein